MNIHFTEKNMHICTYKINTSNYQGNEYSNQSNKKQYKTIKNKKNVEWFSRYSFAKLITTKRSLQWLGIYVWTFFTSVVYCMAVTAQVFRWLHDLFLCRHKVWFVWRLENSCCLLCFVVICPLRRKNKFFFSLKDDLQSQIS